MIAFAILLRRVFVNLLIGFYDTRKESDREDSLLVHPRSALARQRRTVGSISLEEARVWQQLRQSLPDLMLQQFETLGLFTEGSLPAPLDHLPDTFSEFRRQVEKQGERYANQLRILTLSALPPPPGFAEDNRGECPAMAEPDHPNGFTGGEQAGLGQLQSFVFEQQGIARYKQTRNALDDWTGVTALPGSNSSW